MLVHFDLWNSYILSVTPGINWIATLQDHEQDLYRAHIPIHEQSLF